MRIDEVPQDESSTYAGHKKLLYALDSSGAYTGVPSSGWEAEANATLDAVALYQDLADQARAEVEAGHKSPLFFHMHDCRMDLPLLAQLTGFWRWRIKRHFKPKVFAGLSQAALSRYARAMDKTLNELKALPESHP